MRDALEYGATPQREALSEVTLIPEPSLPGESTLNVNVFTPSPGAGSLPVQQRSCAHGRQTPALRGTTQLPNLGAAAVRTCQPAARVP